MKDHLFIVFLAFLLTGHLNTIYAEDFYVPNVDGWYLQYTILNDSCVQYVPGVYADKGENYILTSCDTLIIPDSVKWNGKKYSVTEMKGLGGEAYKLCGCRVIVFPNSLLSIPSPVYWMSGDLNDTSYQLEKFIVSDDHPTLKTENGVLYNKEMTKLLFFPPAFPDSVFIMPEGVQLISEFSMLKQKGNMRYIEFPLSLQTVEVGAIFSYADTIVFKDNLEVIHRDALILPFLNKIYFGNKVDTLYWTSIFAYKPIEVVLRTNTPPHTLFSLDYDENHAKRDQSILYVPRQSVSLYEQADGWKEFGTILPIEPPIVETQDGAIVNWVQNFSATEYVWHLYKDEAHTQLVMSLTFDSNGHLTHIDLGNLSSAPSRMQTMRNDDDDNEPQQRFAEYYSFTISSLQSNTTYYYSRQSLAGDEVIDEETGSFTTTQATLLDEIHGKSAQVNKELRNGQVIINQNKNIYSVSGQQIQ